MPYVDVISPLEAYRHCPPTPADHRYLHFLRAEATALRAHLHHANRTHPSYPLDREKLRYLEARIAETLARIEAPSTDRATYLRMARHMAGFTLSQLATLSGFSEGTIRRHERGLAPLSSVATARRIAAVCAYHIDHPEAHQLGPVYWGRPIRFDHLPQVPRINGLTLP